MAKFGLLNHRRARMVTRPRMPSLRMPDTPAHAFPILMIVCASLSTFGPGAEGEERRLEWVRATCAALGNAQPERVGRVLCAHMRDRGFCPKVRAQKSLRAQVEAGGAKPILETRKPSPLQESRPIIYHWNFLPLITLS